MLILKRYSIPITDKQKLLARLTLDVERFGYFSGLDRFFREEFIIKKPWIGKVYRDKGEFKLIRTRNGVFKVELSAFRIHGKIIDTRINIRISLAWLVAANILGVAAFVSIIVMNYLNDFVGWTILLLILALQVLLLLLDLRKTEKKIIEYLDQIENM